MMLARARESMKAFDTTVALVRGIAEALPFPDGTFSAIPPSISSPRPTSGCGR
jgi:ubiquinone/menaquinone biosynthesis C-methylase UbiE